LSRAQPSSDRRGLLGLSPFLVLCLMGGLAILSSTMAKSPALPLFIRSLGVAEGTVGFIAAASTVVGILVSLPAGILSDMIGRRRVILASMFVFATAPFLYLLVHAPWQLVLVRVYHGLATAILGPVAMAAVADIFDARRGERMAWYSSATMIGRFLAPSVGGLLILGNDFRWVYLVDGVAGLLALAMALQLPRLSQDQVRASGSTEMGQSWRAMRSDLAALFANGALLATSLAEAAQYFAYGFVEVFLPIYMHEVVGLPAWKIGTLLTAEVLVATFSKPLNGRLSDRMGRVPFITLGLLVDAASMALMPRAHSYLALFALVAAFGLGLAMVTASTSAFVADLSKRSTHGAAMGTLSSIMDIGQSGGPMVGGLLVAGFGYKAGFGYVAAGLTVLSLLYAWGVTWLAARAPRPSHVP
jgi:DHA1 family multidrug resistance protein-like MFS transporter